MNTGNLKSKLPVRLNSCRTEGTHLLTLILLLLLCVAFVPACKSTPQQQPTLVAAPTPPPDPNTLPPGQDALDSLDAAKARAEAAREQSLTVKAQEYFPDEWNAAESKNEDGKNTPVDTLGQVKQAIALFTGAADGWESLTVQSVQLTEANNARAAWEAAKARAELSRKKALDNKGDTYFPDDWGKAEGLKQEGDDATKETVAAAEPSDAAETADAPPPAAETATPAIIPTEKYNAAAALYTQAADGYDAIAGKSAARIAAEQEDAKKKAADDAKKLADAQKALAAAQARADKSRQAAMDVDGQSYFANDWKSAETKLQGAKSAKKGTTDEMVAATAQFNGAADAYDSVANKAKAQFAKDKDAATKALKDAIARAQKSRGAVTAAKADTAFANEWKAAETKNQNATKAKQSTIAEMKAATPLYNAAADAYDDIVKKNSVRATAANAVAKAKEKSEKSSAYAQTTAAALATEGSNAQ